MIFFKRPFNHSDTLVLDIGSSGVNGARLGPDEQGFTRIKKISRSPSLILPEVSLKKLWKKMHDTTGEVIRDLTDKESRSGTALVVFSSPWYFPEVHHLFFEREKPFEINKDFMNDFLSKEGDKFKKASLKRFNLDDDEIQVFETEIMHVKLNGYPVRNIMDRRARTIEAFLYLSVVYKRASADIRAMIEDSGIKHVIFKTSPYVFYKVFEQFREEDGQEGVVLVDIGGEVTDVSVIKEGVLLDNASFGLGIHYAVRRLADMFKIDLDESLAMLVSYESGTLEAEKTARIKKALEGVLSQWRDFLEEALMRISQKTLLPEKLLLVGQGAALKELQRFVQEESLGRYTLFGRPFSFYSLPERLSAFFKQIPQALIKPSLLPLSFYLSYAKL